MLSASTRKSVTDLSRRRARAVFAVATLAIAVASVSFLAIPTLIDRAMQDEVRTGRLADVTIAMRPVVLTDEQLERIAALPNVAAVQPRSSVDVRVRVGERRAPARIIGVPRFGRQSVDLVRLESGSFPGARDLLADVQDANVGVYDGDVGDMLTVVVGRGETADFRVSGRARSLPGGEQVQDENVIVLYASMPVVEALSGERGYGELALRLDDSAPPAAARTVEAVRRYLVGAPGFAGLADLPNVRSQGDWPGKADTEAFAQLLGVITVLALLSAVVLVSNTMSTLVAEQTREIAVMRAIGARRRQVAMVYVRTAVLLGTLGAAAGLVLGILLSNLLARYFASAFWAVDAGFGLDPLVLFVSAAVGVLAPALAALPAIRRGLRVDIREGLEGGGGTLGGEGRADRLLRRVGSLPRASQIGLRNVGRRKRRSLATAVIVALAVGNLLAVLAVASSVTDATTAAWGDHLEDVQVSSGRLFDEEARNVIVSTAGVAEAEPVLKNTVELDGREAFVWGLEREPLFGYRLTEGRWFSVGEERAALKVAVIERNIAQQAGVEVGDRVVLETAGGSTGFRIVGVAKNQQEDGTALYVPLTTARRLLGRPDGASAYWIRVRSPEPAVVDRTTSLVEDRLAAIGYDVSTEITYVAERDEVAANRSLTTTIGVLGLVIVAMSMVGLANAITTTVLERTREIGILRSIGARARDVRGIFMTEGFVLALAGWLLGIPLGYALMRLLVWLVWEVVGVRIPVAFPPWSIVVALVGTVVLALVVLALPVRRAVRLRPGEALRYS